MLVRNSSAEGMEMRLDSVMTSVNSDLMDGALFVFDMTMRMVSRLKAVGRVFSIWGVGFIGMEFIESFMFLGDPVFGISLLSNRWQ